jgi:hypothetical protein
MKEVTMGSTTLILLVLAGMLPAAAEEPPEVVAGARVRVSTNDGDGQTGVVENVAADSLLIRLDGVSLPRTLSFAEIDRLELSHGQRSRCSGAWHKAKWGTLIGAVSGLSLGFQHEQVGEDGATVGEAMALGAWSGGVMGGLIGAAIGAIHPGERWENVSPSLVIHPRERGGGFSIGATIEF